jgi:hypothetical protein
MGSSCPAGVEVAGVVMVLILASQVAPPKKDEADEA